MRYFGQFHSAERLLPKYGYASPGALYATQMYLDVSSISGLQDGIYYYNPVSHELMRLDTGCTKGPSRMMLHFIGKHDAIEPIYKNNILEVLEIEAGHMLGLFERVLPDYGLGIRFSHFDGSVKTSLNLADCDYYLGTFQIDRADACTIEDPIETYIQCGSVSVADLDEGTYLFSDNALRKISKDIIKKNDTIAINQAVYERSSFGISFVDRRPLEWTSYIYLGRKLQLLQMNDMNFGFMSSGYSSKTGNPLPASIKLSQIVGGQITSSYFVVGGKVSDEQFLCKGMKEDSIHMKGPLELLKDDLDSFLPHYMRPNRILILDSLPTTVNGKIDKNALKTIDVSIETKKFIPPKTKLEHELANLWKKALKRDVISLNDNFFECGGNSLTAVRLINQMNTTLCLSLPMQIFFEAPSIADIVFYVGYSLNTTASRLISLNSKNDGKEIVYCWPGLGGYCMNLAALANAINEKYSFYGIQAYGLNENEQPYETIVQMAEHDLRLITAMQPSGPYKLWGYSFGARVAYEVAYQLESRGERVEELLLIAPGSPKVEGSSEYSDSLIYKNKKFITILYSVFMGEIKGNGVIECLEKVESKESFMDFISNKCKNLNAEFIEKIITLVELTFEFEYTFEELKQRHIKAPVKMIKAKGDDYSFIEHNNFHSIFTDIYEADVDHYEILKPVTVEKLVSAIEFLNANNINVA